jgi:hypothetical protein
LQTQLRDLEKLQVKLQTQWQEQERLQERQSQP